MNKRTIRYKKPDWKNWAYMVVEESKVAETISILESQGYEVEA